MFLLDTKQKHMDNGTPDTSGNWRDNGTTGHSKETRQRILDDLIRTNTGYQHIQIGKE